MMGPIERPLDIEARLAREHAATLQEALVAMRDALQELVQMVRRQAMPSSHTPLTFQWAEPNAQGEYV